MVLMKVQLFRAFLLLLFAAALLFLQALKSDTHCFKEMHALFFHTNFRGHQRIDILSDTTSASLHHNYVSRQSYTFPDMHEKAK
jgi:hypothetical protein